MADNTLHLDDSLVENIALAAHVANLIVLAGARQYDRFLLGNPDGQPRTWSLERLCHESVAAAATWGHDPATGRVRLVRAAEGLDLNTTLPAKPGGEKELPLLETLAAFSAVPLPDQAGRLVLVVNAGLLMEDPAMPRDRDFRLLQAMEHFSRDGDRSHLLILRASRLAEVAPGLLASPLLKTVHIPSASRDVRHAYVGKMGQAQADACSVAVDALAQTVSDATEDWTLEQVDALLQTAQGQNITRLQDLEELARAIRIGTSISPWAGERIRGAVGRAREDLTRRVMGQSKAVDAVVSALRKAVTGLSNAHQGQCSQAPRALLFFAGPTGTGKTEMAKAISQLVFGEERLLRFDCGELRQEQAVARLIGAPPGYVGYDRGGELTEGIRAKPNSVVLFDEIEKAHPRLLDTLLGVLDDGRLTSGQGETAYFGQSVLLFTSNLGMYEETQDEHGQPVRRPRFDYGTPFETVEREVRDAIRDEFITHLGRPELLGRFGGAESIIVFDYLRDIARVCRKFVANIVANVRRLQGLELSVDDAVIEHVVQAVRTRPDALVLGGRGIRPELDRVLTNSLSDWLFDVRKGQKTLRVSLVDGRFSVVPKAAQAGPFADTKEVTGEPRS